MSSNNYLLYYHFQDDFVDMLNLLWRYYEKNREYYAAAKILERMAEKPGSVIPQEIVYIPFIDVNCTILQGSTAFVCVLR